MRGVRRSAFTENEGTSAISGPKTTLIERRTTDFPRFTEDIDWGIDDPRVDTADVRIVDPESGDEVTEPGEVGEVAFRGPGLMAGYYNQPELTVDAFDEDGYFFTGDLFRVEEDGYMSFFDRKKDVIIRGGFTISAKKVENIVIEHPKVADAAVVGERVVVFDVPQSAEELAFEDITEYMGDDIAVYTPPERLETVEEIPRNPVGKIVKTKLRERLRTAAVDD